MGSTSIIRKSYVNYTIDSGRSPAEEHHPSVQNLVKGERGQASYQAWALTFLANNRVGVHISLAQAVGCLPAS